MKNKTIKLIMVLLGMWLWVDSALNILFSTDQRLISNFGRIIRFLVGIILVVLIFYIKK